MRAKILLLALSCLAALLLGEIYLRINPPVLLYMETRNIVQHTHSELSPNHIIGYIPKANLHKEFENLEFKTWVHINSKNMRDKEYNLEKPSDKTRIAVFGDSFVFGWGVENHEAFSEILEHQLLEKTEVLNFGVSGYAAHQQLERLKDEGLLFSPDVVLFTLYGFPEAYPRDTSDSFQLSGDGLLYRIRPDLPISKIRTWYRSVTRNSYLYRLVRGAIGTFIDLSGCADCNSGRNWERSAEEKREGLKILDTLKELGEEKQFKPVVVWIPTKDVVEMREPQDSSETAEYCAAKGISFLDLTPHLIQFQKSSGRSPYFKIDDHWNRDGHHAAAAAIKDFLISEGLAHAKK